VGGLHSQLHHRQGGRETSVHIDSPHEVTHIDQEYLADSPILGVDTLPSITLYFASSPFTMTAEMPWSVGREPFVCGAALGEVPAGPF
jgi:hypothetical protein